MKIDVTWSRVYGTEVDLTDEDLHAAVADGIDLWDTVALGNWWRGQPNAADNLEDGWHEALAPEVHEWMVYGDPPEWYTPDDAEATQ